MVKRIRTSYRNNERLTPIDPIELSESIDLDRRIIYVDPKQKFQTHIGFGGALTRCTCCNLDLLGEERAKNALKSYFSKEEGIGYSLLRHPIGSCDFGPYSYDYLPKGANDLSAFCFDEEKSAIAYSKSISEIRKDVVSIGSVWSAPTYMKQGEDRCYGTRLKDECLEDWAEWICLYLQAMKEAGHPIDWINCQNEPEAKQVWESTYITAQQEGKLIKNYLYPALRRHGLENTKILIWDHNKDEMVRRSNVTLQDPEVDELVYGISYHWYVSNNFGNVELTHVLHPDKAIVFTEGCVEWENLAYEEKGAGDRSQLKAAEKYGLEIIEALNHHTSAFIDWNMIVDEEGGPSWVGNYCGAPVILDRPSNSLIHTLAYYYIGHFSKYIERGARRLFCRNDFESEVYATAYENPNGEIVIVAMNTGWIKEPALCIGHIGATVSLAPHSITTFIVDSGKEKKI